MTTNRRTPFSFHWLGCSALLLAGAWPCLAQTQTAAVSPPPPPVSEPAPDGADPQDQQTTVAAEPARDGFTMGGFVFKPGGRIKLDVLRDFKPIGSEDSFDPRTI